MLFRSLGIGTDGLITLGRQGTGDGVITTDIGTTVTTRFTTDGGKVRNVSCLGGRLFMSPAACLYTPGSSGGV